jgi:hypothetical protein
MSQRLTPVVVVSFLGVSLACGEDTGVSPEPGGAGAGGQGGTAGAAGEAGAGGALAVPGDADALAACATENPCAEAGIQLVESSTYTVRQAEAGCVLDALARRTPGLYVHETDSTHTGGSTGARHLLLIEPNGGVLYVRTLYENDRVGGVSTTPEGAQRCTLKPAEYFEACRAAIDAPRTEEPRSEDPAWACLFGDGDATTPSRLAWFDSCAGESPPVCE